MNQFLPITTVPYNKYLKYTLNLSQCKMDQTSCFISFLIFTHPLIDTTLFQLQVARTFKLGSFSMIFKPLTINGCSSSRASTTINNIYNNDVYITINTQVFIVYINNTHTYCFMFSLLQIAIRANGYKFEC